MRSPAKHRAVHDGRSVRRSACRGCAIALVGGLIGAGIAKAGPSAAVWHGVGVIGSAIVLSPLIGFLFAMILVLATTWLAIRSTPFAVDRRFRILQFVSSSLLSLAHGGNDAQKTMGIITVLLQSQGLLSGGFHVPLWVVISCQSAMALGTLCAAGGSCVRSAHASRT